MMKKIALLTIVATLAFTGCVDVDCCVPGVISIDVNTLTFISAGETKEINLDCPMEWEIQDPVKVPDWLEIDPLNHSGSIKVTITAKENEKPEIRDFIVIFVASNGDKFILQVIQLKDNYFDFKSNEEPRWEWDDGSTVREEINANYRYIFITDNGFVKSSGERLFSSVLCKTGRITSPDGSTYEILEIKDGFTKGAHPESILRTEIGIIELDYLEIVKIENGKLWIVFKEKNASIERRIVQ